MDKALASAQSIHILDIEAAINHWRAQSPSTDGISLNPAIKSLATSYALMVFHRQQEVDADQLPSDAFLAWMAWYETTPDAPCIAICSTSQGDKECKGCGRTFEEVQHWPSMSPVAKRQTWRRITQAGVAWRFNRYAERALGSCFAQA